MIRSKSCNNIICIILNANNTKGKKKWRLKNRFNVASFTEYPPHNHNTISLPKYGIAVNKLVITVAAQNDICPHGNT